MNNFDFLSPTKIIFGKDTETRVGSEVKNFSRRILLHYGGGSIKESGLYDRVTSSLREAGVEFIELSGVKPNPRLSLVHEGINLCRQNKIDFILAVGGGSVIDSAKAIALGVRYAGEVWDFYSGKVDPGEALPIGVILTIAAAGSEGSKSSVITNEDGWYKRGLDAESTRPRFSILNPELGYTLPTWQTACGAADIMAHVMERYFTNVSDVDFTDRLCEATLQTVIKNTPIALAQPDNYNARAEILWASTIAHNDFLGTGRTGDWSSHMIEHELSGIYDVAHGAGLSVVFPAWMKFVYKKNINKFIQFAVRVWGVEYDFECPERTALEGIKRLERFFRDIGLPVTLKELNIPADKFEEMSRKCVRSADGMTGQFVKLSEKDIISILDLAK